MIQALASSIFTQVCTTLFCNGVGRAVVYVAFFLGLNLPGVQAQQTASPTTRPVRQSDDPLLITFALTPERSEYLADSMPDYQFRMYDPARKHTVDYGTLG
ncbi:MAG TPA: hypothetical protein DCF33_06440, partial [Saprospirales bacterium]|nr:hypothetical protein [Saprospirales bacterium]